jgi:hypothetical protein
MIWEKKKVQREKETERRYTGKGYRAKGRPSLDVSSLAPCHSFIRYNFTYPSLVIMMCIGTHVSTGPSAALMMANVLHE